MNNKEEQTQPITNFGEQSSQSLRQHVTCSLQKHFEQLGDTPTTNIYDMVLKEVEESLLKKVMWYAKGNQSKAAILLGLSRGTLRKKLIRYGMLKGSSDIKE